MLQIKIHSKYVSCLFFANGMFIKTIYIAVVRPDIVYCSFWFCCKLFFFLSFIVISRVPSLLCFFFYNYLIGGRTTTKYISEEKNPSISFIQIKHRNNSLSTHTLQHYLNLKFKSFTKMIKKKKMSHLNHLYPFFFVYLMLFQQC